MEGTSPQPKPRGGALRALAALPAAGLAILPSAH